MHVDGAAPEVDPVEQVGHPPPDQQGTQASGVTQHLVEGEHHKVGLHQTQVYNFCGLLGTEKTEKNIVLLLHWVEIRAKKAKKSTKIVVSVR